MPDHASNRMTSYIDIHTHAQSATGRDAASQDIFALYNLHDGFHRAASLQNCSIGIHPWYLDEVDKKFDDLLRYATLPSVRAIGECGLDKNCPTDFDLQTEIFKRQIDLANRLGKPLIIHCVRAFEQAITLLKQATVPVIFHGFQKNPALAQNLVAQGFYLSFGAALTQDKKNAIDSLSLVSADRFFLETDDAAISIRDIYQKAAALRQTSEDVLIEQIHRNYRTVFKT